MKGFRDNSGKFRPTENKNGVRKPRDQQFKTQGIKLERKRRDDTEYRIGDTVEYWDGKVGTITFVRNDFETQKPLQYKINGKFVEPESIKEHKHKFDHLDYEDGIERGHCMHCGNWVDTSTGKIEKESL